ncbi:bifunctional diguanylate cyclase/phosphodiesterase, partial [Aliivibrio kagoshimensis]|uniref:bifunctional diguanylate cyclase/phosphodiesterase n=1 Tax=Aliivibrio kagoshimensis TaxID=2910230 RepID=UPI003D0B3246
EYKNRINLQRSNFIFMGLFAVVAIVASALFAYKMSIPIKALSQHAKAIGDGNYDKEVSVDQNDELGELADNLDQMRINLKKQLHTIRTMAYVDDLTCLPNRRSFTETIEQYISLHLPFHILFIDLDDFKRINDQFGHETGDIYLKEYCNNILAFCASNFPADTFHIARMGGDELTIMIQQESLSIVDAGLFANQLCHALSTPINIKDKRLNVSLSIGVTSFPQDATNASQLLSYADIALYQAKSLGKKMAVVFDNQLLKVVLSEYALRDKLIHAIENKLFYLNYQPIINISSKKAIGFEVLLRLGYGETRLSPDAFIPLAEKMSIIDQMTYQVIEQVCFDLQNATNFFGTVSINISGLLIDSIDFFHKTMSILDRYNISTERIALEVTETVMISNFDSAIEGLYRLKKAGFTIYLDDFGSGYSSLKYLQKLPIDVVKIDKNLIQNAANGISIFSSIINLCKALQLQIIVEGVESSNQLEICDQTGCDMVQGYYFSKPMKWSECKPFQNTFVDFIGPANLIQPVKIYPV